MADTAKPDAIALLKADHRKVEGLFEQYEAAKGGAKKVALAKEICTELIVHTTVEEEIFYPACKAAVEADLLSEGYVEHDGAKVLIAELLAGDPSDPFYDAKMKVLSEDIEHHVKEEERRSEGLFAQARAGGLDMDALGLKMAARKAALLKQIKAEGLPAPKTRTFTGHALDQGAPVVAAGA